MNEIDRAYLAGFFDGEGCVFIVRSQIAPVVQLRIGQRNRKLLEEIQDMLGCGTVKDMWVGNGNCEWRVSNREDVLRIIDLIEPYSKLKKSQLRLARQLTQLVGPPGRTGIASGNINTRLALAREITEAKKVC